MRNLLRKTLVLVILTTTLLLLAGCEKRSFIEEKTLVAMSQEYVENVAAKKFELVLPMLTGDALDGFRMSLPILEALEVTNKVSDFEAECDFMNRKNDRASVEVSYLQEQTIEGFGTSLVELNSVLEFKKLNNEWKIYEVKIIQKQDRH